MADDERNMSVIWYRKTEGLENEYLIWCVGDMVFAAHD